MCDPVRCSLGGGPLPLPLRRRPPFLCGETSPVRPSGGLGRSTAGGIGGKTRADEIGKFAHGDLAIAKLGALLRCGHSGGVAP